MGTDREIGVFTPEQRMDLLTAAVVAIDDQLSNEPGLAEVKTAKQISQTTMRLIRVWEAQEEVEEAHRGPGDD